MDREEKRAYIIYLNVATYALDRMEEEDEKLLLTSEEIPVDMQSRMKQAIQEVRNQEVRKLQNHVSINKAGKLIAGILICVIIAGGILIGNVTAIKETLYQFLVQKQEDHMDVVQESTSQLEYTVRKEFSKWDSFYYPSLLPEGYGLLKEECQSERDCKTIIFRKDDNKLYFIQQYSNGVNLKFDSENAKVEELTIQKEPAVLIRKNNRLTLLWLHNNMQFQLIGTLNQKEMMMVAESIFYVK